MMSNATKIVELWQQNLTSYQIAERLGISRNAVLGSIRRQKAKGVALRGRILPPEKAREPETPKMAVIQKPKPVERLFDFVAPPAGVTILALRGNSCRFIVGEDETPIYCGKEKVRGAYCAAHYAACYVPVKKAMQQKMERMARRLT
jgi:hypothetical protein